MTESTGRYVVVVESKIANSRVGVTIGASDELDHAAAVALAHRIVSGDEPTMFKPSKNGRILRVAEGQFLELKKSATLSLQLARITVTEVVA